MYIYEIKCVISSAEHIEKVIGYASDYEFMVSMVTANNQNKVKLVIPTRDTFYDLIHSNEYNTYCLMHSISYDVTLHGKTETRAIAYIIKRIEIDTVLWKRDVNFS